MKRYVPDRIFVNKGISKYIKGVITTVANSCVIRFFEVNKTIFITCGIRAICIQFVLNTYGLFFCRSPPVT